MSTEKTYLCDEYKLYFKIEDDVQILHNEVELYNTSFVGNNSFCHEEYIDGQRALTYSIPAMITMNQFITKKIHRDELVDIMFSYSFQKCVIKDLLWISHGPSNFNASICSLDPYPLFFANPYPG